MSTLFLRTLRDAVVVVGRPLQQGLVEVRDRRSGTTVTVAVGDVARSL
jgi:hypothetical protein